jgi:hypothetical protein
VKIAFALVAHGSPRLSERLIQVLISAGHLVAVHYDLKSSEADYRQLRRAFEGYDLVRFAHRMRVGWAEWSIVAATLSCLDEIEASGWQPDYVYNLSAADYPIRSSRELVAFLDRNNGKEFIESVPADTVRWARTGPQQERYQYRFYFNWRDQSRLCEFFWSLQKQLRLKRKFVRGMIPYIGSQWWVLTWGTLRKVIELGRQRDIERFFRTILVPDELFFQTMVRYLVAESRIVNRTLTLYQFSDYGLPVVYYADHVEYLTRQPFFMARKLSPFQTSLRDALDGYWRGERSPLPVDDADIGERGEEYETRRLTYRDGVPGQPVPGRTPKQRYGDLERLAAPFFAVIGTSTAELRPIYKALSQHPNILCHGQLFHRKCIEFANGRSSFAGYDADAVKLRRVAPGNFLADVVRAGKHRMTGFLLRPEQGWHIPAVIFERPNVRVLIARGDPLIAFSEYLRKVEPMLDERFDETAFQAIPPSVLVNRFRCFLKEHRQFSNWLTKQAARAANVKPQGWVTEVDLTALAPIPVQPTGGLPVFPSSARSETALQGWRDGSAQVRACLGFGSAEIGSHSGLSTEWESLKNQHWLVFTRLVASGMDNRLLEGLQSSGWAGLHFSAGVGPWHAARASAAAD